MELFNNVCKCYWLACAIEASQPDALALTFEYAITLLPCVNMRIWTPTVNVWWFDFINPAVCSFLCSCPSCDSSGNQAGQPPFLAWTLMVTSLRIVFYSASHCLLSLIFICWVLLRPYGQPFEVWIHFNMYRFGSMVIRSKVDRPNMYAALGQY